MKSTWRFVLKIVGLSLALAGLICVVIGFWDKLAEEAVAAKDAVCGKRRCSANDPSAENSPGTAPGRRGSFPSCGASRRFFS